MQAKNLVGPEAASLKYDLLTALGCHALASGPGVQRLVLRFLTLLTARYDWRRGLLHVGQREIARLWAVDERTVKREMAKLRALGWLTVESPARRGRVASYALDLVAVRVATRDAWPRVGEDFDTRMRGMAEPPAGGTVVPFPRPEPRTADETDEPRSGDLWAVVRRRLEDEDAPVFATWFAALRCADDRAPVTFVAPSAFHASYVRAHYAERLARALHGATGVPTEFRIVVAGRAGGHDFA